MYNNERMSHTSFIMDAFEWSEAPVLVAHEKAESAQDLRQADALGFDAGQDNFYSFAGNGPTNAVDPTGEFENKEIPPELAKELETFRKQKALRDEDVANKAILEFKIKEGFETIKQLQEESKYFTDERAEQVRQQRIRKLEREVGAMQVKLRELKRSSVAFNPDKLSDTLLNHLLRSDDIGESMFAKRELDHRQWLGQFTPKAEPRAPLGKLRVGTVECHGIGLSVVLGGGAQGQIMRASDNAGRTAYLLFVSGRGGLEIGGGYSYLVFRDTNLQELVNGGNATFDDVSVSALIFSASVGGLNSETSSGSLGIGPPIVKVQGGASIGIGSGVVVLWKNF